MASCSQQKIVDEGDEEELLGKYFMHEQFHPYNELIASYRIDKTDDLRSIRQWITKQPHLPGYISDGQILTLLHSCYDSIELTKKTIDAYFTIRTHASDLFDRRTAREVEESSKVVYCVILPKKVPIKTYGCCTIIMMGFVQTDPSLPIVLQFLRSALATFDLLVHDDPLMEGFCLVLDMNGFAFGHLVKLTAALPLIAKLISFVQDGLPVRLKGVHVFNAIPMVHQFLALVKPIMNKKLYDLIRIHPTNDVQSFYSYVPQESLPKNYGGQQPSIDQLIKISNEMMRKYEDWFVADDKFGRVDETKRIGEPKTADDIFAGMDGSFKKLDID